MPQSFDRRDFLRRAALSAGTIGTAATLGSMAGCGKDPAKPPSAPVAPSGLTVQATGPTRILVSWTDNSEDETGFELERKAGGDLDFTPLADVPEGTTSYEDTSVVERTRYDYRVRAVREDLASDYSGVSSAQTPSANAPAAPAGVRAEGLTAGSVRLVWEDQAETEGGFRVESRSGDAVTILGTVNENVTEFLVNGLEPDRLYSLSVVAFNDAGDSARSNEVAVRTGVSAGSLSLRVPVPRKVELSWLDLSAGGTAFTIERKTGDGDFATLATLPTGSTSFADTDIPLGVRLEYRVAASDETSIASSLAADIPGEAPPAPTEFLAAIAPSNGSHVLLTWSSVEISGGFQIQRKTEQTAFVDLPALPGDARTHEDAPGRTFAEMTYRVRSFNAAGYSEFSATSMAVTRATYFLTGIVAAITTIGKGVRVNLNVPPIFYVGACRSTTEPTQVHLVRTAENTVAAVVANCTHQCCVTGYQENVADATQGQFNCPCHGSQFRMDGSVKRGPAFSAEPTFQTILFEDRVELIPDRSIPQA